MNPHSHKAEALFRRAQNVMPGGVASSTRLNKAIDIPFYVSRGKGSHLYNLDGESCIDMCCSHGAGLLGHGHPAVVTAMRQAEELGYTCAAESEHQVELAEKLCDMIPCYDRVRFCTSGSEATLHMLRACRAYTGRDKVIRLVGHFHGYHEFLYIGGQPPMDRLVENQRHPYRESSGIPAMMCDLVIPVPFNDLDALSAAIEKHRHEAGTVVLEPVNYNSGGIQAAPGYLASVRALTQDAGMLLFFDEIQSSFKKSRGGAQTDFGVIPDVCTIGKSLGGGIPLSAFGGRAEIMDLYQPRGTVAHSGTFNAHLTQILGGLAFIDEVNKPDFYPRLEALGARLFSGLDAIVKRLAVPMLVTRHGARFNIIMGLTEEPKNYAALKDHDRDRMLAFIRASIERGVYYHDYGGGPAHHGYSIQHTEQDVDRVLEITEEVLSLIW